MSANAHRTLIILGAALVGLVAVGPALADPPQLILYQALLTDSAGVPLTGTHNLNFAIYDAATLGTSLWSESRPSFDFGAGGAADILLGEVTPLTSGHTP